MKTRTKAIHAALSRLSSPHVRIENGWIGVCNAINSGGSGQAGVEASLWFSHTFRPEEGDAPIDYDWCLWLGLFSQENYERRLTFIAMAMAVSETEE